MKMTPEAGREDLAAEAKPNWTVRIVVIAWFVVFLGMLALLVWLVADLKSSIGGW